jgi:ubiquinone biosynthesis UbiH/UbiF/VisC/COQ6 family hydroxylase
MNERYAVAIVGGGIVGATLALLLARSTRLAPQEILLLERDPPRAPRTADPFDLRVSAVSPANRAMLLELGAWQAMDATRIADYERMVIWQELTPPDSPDVLRFDAAELGARDLGSIVENRTLQAALLQRCVEEGVQLHREGAGQIAFGPDAVTLQVADSTITAELVVGADGAESAVREAAGISAQRHDYGQQAIVATVRGDRGHANTAWQRFLSTGPLALLPLASGECSIVWSMIDARVEALMTCASGQFNAALTEASAGVLGRIELQGKRAVFPLRNLKAARYVSDRCALVGDAAHVIHPLAGQGVNQGLQDAAALAAALAERPARESVGARRALLRYERERRAGNAVMGGLVDGLDQLFTQSGDLPAWAARAGMALVNRSAMAKRFFFTRAAAGRSSPRR